MKNKPENCICDDEMDVACPFHGQKALDELLDTIIQEVKTQVSGKTEFVNHQNVKDDIKSFIAEAYTEGLNYVHGNDRRKFYQRGFDEGRLAREEEIRKEVSRLEDEVLPTHAEENGYSCGIFDVLAFLDKGSSNGRLK